MKIKVEDWWEVFKKDNPKYGSSSGKSHKCIAIKFGEYLLKKTKEVENEI